MTGLSDENRRLLDEAYARFVDELRVAIQLSLASGMPLVMHVELHPALMRSESAYLALIEHVGDVGGSVGDFWVAEPPAG